MDRRLTQSSEVMVRHGSAGRPLARGRVVALAALLCCVALLTGPVFAQENQQGGPAGQPQADDAGRKPAPNDAQPQAGRAKGAKAHPDAKGPPSRGALTEPARKRKARAAIPTETPKGPVTGAPAIRCDQTVKNFGILWSSDKAEHTFILRNGGDQVLEIESVRPSCGCTVTKNYDRRIAPGQTGKVPVSLSTKRVHSRFEKQITVTSNDPVTPKLRLAIKGEVKQYVELTPPRLSFRQMKPDEEMTLQATLTNNTERPLVLTLPEPPEVGAFTAELSEKEPGQVYELTVHAKPPYQSKRNLGKFVLKTNLPEQPTVDVHVNAYVPPRLNVTPEELTIRQTGAADQTRLLNFSNSGDTLVKVLSAEANDENLEVSVIEQQEGKQYRISVTVKAGYMPPPSGRELTIKTDDPEFPELKVPVKGRPPQPVRPASKLVGKPVPSFEFKTFDDQPVTNEDYAGKLVVLDFFRSTCGFCKKQIPMVSRLYTRKYADNPNVQFLAVSEDILRNPDDTEAGKGARTKEEVAATYEQIGGAFPSVLDPDRIGPRQFQLGNHYPTVILVGKDGVVEAVHFGAKNEVIQVLETQIDLLLAGKTRADFPPDESATRRSARASRLPAGAPPAKADAKAVPSKADIAAPPTAPPPKPEAQPPAAKSRTPAKPAQPD